jgi:hypothetical protein
LYPTLGAAFLGAIPTYLEAFKSHNLGVPFGESRDAEKQTTLWQHNYECSRSAEFRTIVTPENVEIGSTVCASGDVLLRGKRPGSQYPQFRWVSWDQVAAAEASGGSLFALLDPFPVASAAENVGEIVLAQGGILCQRWVGNGLLLQRITTPQGCFDQVINTYSGWVVNRTRAPCDPHC